MTNWKAASGAVRHSTPLSHLRNLLALGTAPAILALGLAAIGPAAAQNQSQPPVQELPAQAETLPVPEDQPLPYFIGTVRSDIGVMDRLRPEYDAKGIPLGAFRLFPELTSGVNYDDNVRRVNTNPVSDWYFQQSPTLRLQSDWGRHFAEIYAGLDNYTYASQDTLNLTDWNVGGDGRYDVSRALVVALLGSYGRYHENLQSPNTVGGQISPNRFYRGHGELTGDYKLGELGLGLGASVNRLDWGTTPRNGAAPINNFDRDQTEFQAYVRGLYTIYPGYAAFVKVLYDQRSFDNFFDRNGLHRSSHGYRFNAGADLQLTNLVEGEIYFGYLEQYYAKNVPMPLPNVSGLDYGVNLHWYATPLLTVHLTGQRQVSDITIYQAAATTDAFVKLSADYEFRRNILLQAYFSYQNSSFIGLTRKDEYPGAGINARWLMNSYMSADLGYNYANRSSNNQFVGFEDNMITLALNLHI